MRRNPSETRKINKKNLLKDDRWLSSEFVLVRNKAGSQGVAGSQGLVREMMACSEEMTGSEEFSSEEMAVEDAAEDAGC